MEIALSSLHGSAIAPQQSRRGLGPHCNDPGDVLLSCPSGDPAAGSMVAEGPADTSQDSVPHSCPGQLAPSPSYPIPKEGGGGRPTSWSGTPACLPLLPLPVILPDKSIAYLIPPWHLLIRRTN